MTMPELLLQWCIPVLFMLSAAGLAYIVQKALASGVDAYASEYTTDTARQFEDVFLFIPPARITQIAWVSAAIAFSVVFFLAGNLTSVWGVARGFVFGTIAGTIALYTPRLLLAILRHRRLRRFNEQLVDALVSMSNALKAGFSISQAFESIVREGLNPISQEFSVFLQQMRVGVRFEDALDNLDKRVGSEDLTLMIRSIEIARITGGNLTDVLGKIAETIRERMRIAGRIRSLTAQGRMQGIVVGLVPVFLGLAMFGLDPVMMSSFITSPIGLMILFVVVILEIAGGLLIRKIINIDI